MPRRSSAVRLAGAVILLTIAWIDGAGVEWQARALACCTHRQDCTGNLRAPDTCCEHMGHTVPGKTGTMVQSSLAIALVPLALITPDLGVEPFSIVRSNQFVRPHDPPHLHTFELLI